VTNSRVLTRLEFEEAVWRFAAAYDDCTSTKAGEIYAPIRAHDAAQREEIARLRERLREALETGKFAVAKMRSANPKEPFWEDRDLCLSAIRADVFGQEGKETK